MGWISKLFGSKPERRKEAQTGFYWQIDGVPALAAGKGWTQEVVGESFYRSTLENLTKGETTHGVLVSHPAELVAGEYDGSRAVFVHMAGKRVGSIPKADCNDLFAELLTVASGGRASAKGQISAGYEGADYCVKLSLARPLKARA